MPAAVMSMSVMASHCRTIHDGWQLACEVSELPAERGGVGEEQR